jgi:dephospho-CoA kinase
MLVDRGARLVDADQIAREVVLPGSPALEEIADRFGRIVLKEDGTLDRKRLGEIVFSDPQAKRDLEQILHPRIRQLIRERKESLAAEHPRRPVIVDIPLLFESGMTEGYDEIMVVYVPEEVQLRRLMERDGLTTEQAMNRIRSQMPIEEKKRRADVVIDNSGTLKETEDQIIDYWTRKGLPLP